jgi:hypothetical protein
MAALKTWHALHNAHWASGPRLNYVLRAVTNLAPASSTKPKRTGVSRNDPKTPHSGLDINTPFDAAVFTAATMAFWGQLRLGEILGSSRLKHNPACFPSRSSIPPRRTGISTLSIQLPCTKTSQQKGERVLITTQLGIDDPIAAFTNHLRVNSAGVPSTAHLFAFTAQPKGPIRCLTKEAFLAHCNDIWTSDGSPKFTGHSFRIGRTNEFLTQGFPPEVVKQMGRWKSNTFFTYWRDTNAIAERHAHQLGLAQRRMQSQARL